LFFGEYQFFFWDIDHACRNFAAFQTFQTLRNKKFAETIKLIKKTHPSFSLLHFFLFTGRLELHQLTILVGIKLQQTPLAILAFAIINLYSRGLSRPAPVHPFRVFDQNSIFKFLKAQTRVGHPNPKKILTPKNQPKNSPQILAILLILPTGI
jgi:hypothetical protein